MYDKNILHHVVLIIQKSSLSCKDFTGQRCIINSYYIMAPKSWVISWILFFAWAPNLIQTVKLPVFRYFQILSATLTWWFLNLATEETEYELTQTACMSRAVAAGKKVTGGKKGGQFNVKDEVSWYVLKKQTKKNNYVVKSTVIWVVVSPKLHLHHVKNNHPALKLQSIICAFS